MDDVKKGLSEDWGERKLFGAVYMVELIQGNKHFAVGEITVTYENVSATYRLIYEGYASFWYLRKIGGIL